MGNRLRELSLWTLGVISLLAAVVDTILLTLAAVIFTIHQIKINGIAFAASGLQLVSLVVLAGLLWRRACSQLGATQGNQVSRIRRNADVCVSFAMTLVAGSITLATILWMRIILNNLPIPMLGQQPFNFLLGVIVTFVISTLSSLAVYALLLFSRQSSRAYSNPLEPSNLEVTMSRPETSKSIVSNPFTGTSSPSLSPSSTSLRSSITLPTRPGSSKTRLVNSRPTSKSADVSPFDWDTSTVPSALREAVHTHSRNVPSTLPSIPGSRPVSPAKALDGPFLPPSPHPPQSQPSSPDQGVFTNINSSSVPGSTSTESLPLMLPKPPFLSSTPDKSRSRSGSLASRTTSSDSLRHHNAPKRTVSVTSLVNSVSHLRTVPSFDSENIHPLFRPSSSTPPPVTSKRTNIHGATVGDAEEVVSPGGRRRAEIRMASPLARGAEWFSGDEMGESRGEAGSRLFSESPITPTTADEWKMMAPIVDIKDTAPKNEHVGDNEGGEKKDEENPIPDFVLAAGQRGSFLGFERRRKSEAAG